MKLPLHVENNMEEDEDKELMRMRLEMLQSMIGKLKKSTDKKEEKAKTTTSSSVLDKEMTSKQTNKPKILFSRKPPLLLESTNRYKYSSSNSRTVNIVTNEETRGPINRTAVAVNSKHKYIKPAFQKSTMSKDNMHVSKDIRFTSTYSKNSITTPSLNTAANKLTRIPIEAKVGNKLLHVSKNKIVRAKSSVPEMIHTRHKLIKPGGSQLSSSSRHTTQTNLPRSVTSNFSVVNIPLKNPVLNSVTAHRKVPQRVASGSVSSVSKLSASRYKIINTTLTSSSNAAKSGILHTIQPTSGGRTVVRRRFFLIKNSPAKLYKKPVIHSASKYSSYKTHLKKSFTTRRVKYLRKSPAVQIKASTAKFPLQLDTKASPKKDILLKRHGSNFVVSNNMKSLHKLKTPVSLQDPSVKIKNTPSSSKSKFQYRRSNSKSSTNATSAKQLVASKLVRKNIMIQQRKKVNKTKYCLFYNRFGKCKRGEECRFIHDPNKIAVCTRFLRGTCTDDKCLFSHKVDPSKMPVCSYFLLSQCTRDNCPYRHVNVGDDAAVCEDFLKGYCPEGDKCKKKHVLECPEFTSTGKCNRKTCTLLHKPGKKKRRRTRSGSGLRKPRVFSQKRMKLDGATVTDGELSSPLRNKGKSHLLPKFINDKIHEDRYEASRALSFSTVRNLFTTDTNLSSGQEDEQAGPSGLNAPDTVGHEYIPLCMSSEEEGSEDESVESRHERKFSMTEKDFISLE